MQRLRHAPMEIFVCCWFFFWSVHALTRAATGIVARRSTATAEGTARSAGGCGFSLVEGLGCLDRSTRLRARLRGSLPGRAKRAGSDLAVHCFASCRYAWPLRPGQPDEDTAPLCVVSSNSILRRERIGALGLMRVFLVEGLGLLGGRSTRLRARLRDCWPDARSAREAILRSTRLAFCAALGLRDPGNK
jgi:hypothetical protein